MDQAECVIQPNDLEAVTLAKEEHFKSFYTGFATGNQTVQWWVVQSKQAKSDRAKESICNSWSRSKNASKKKRSDSME